LDGDDNGGWDDENVEYERIKERRGVARHFPPFFPRRGNLGSPSWLLVEEKATTRMRLMAEAAFCVTGNAFPK